MKDFEEIYNDVYNMTVSQIDDAKANKRKFLMITFLVLLAMNIAIYFIVDIKAEVTVSISISAVIILILFITSRTSYKRMYKQIVIESLVKSFNEKYNYDINGISLIEYKISEFDSKFDEFKSEDRIYGKLSTGDRIQFAEITTYMIREYRDSNGTRNEERKKTFNGMYGIINLEKNLLANIQITLNSILNKYDKDRIEMESSEFEKEYDLITKDKVLAMRIFTPEIIEELNLIKRSTKTPIEIRIDENKIFFRYKCGQMFEPPIIKNGLDKDVIKNYYNLVYYPINIFEKICKNINNIAKNDEM